MLDIFFEEFKLPRTSMFLGHGVEIESLIFGGIAW